MSVSVLHYYVYRNLGGLKKILEIIWVVQFVTKQLFSVEFLPQGWQL